MSSYNGCSNYQTWVYKLWLDNEENVLESYATTIQRSINHNNPRILANYLSDILNDQIDSIVIGGVLLDLLLSASEEIDFLEIAECILVDYKNEYMNPESEDL